MASSCWEVLQNVLLLDSVPILKNIIFFLIGESRWNAMLWWSGQVCIHKVLSQKTHHDNVFHDRDIEIHVMIQIFIIALLTRYWLKPHKRKTLKCIVKSKGNPLIFSYWFIVHLVIPEFGLLWYTNMDNISIDTLRPRQDGLHFADGTFKCIFFYENCCILIKISLKYVPKGSIDNNPALVHIIAGAADVTSHYIWSNDGLIWWHIWIRSRDCGCLVTWFCYQLIAKPGNKTATVSWPDPYICISWPQWLKISAFLFVTRGLILIQWSKICTKTNP